ncbi:unnamed protein product [Rotaria socialis]|uniref:Uncharacterized protein n=3 Tax=Rotaria socialis TaxID=392032 RepID=A0A820K146_9BILA|nr:unnamed protein product [Rotaria socialis]CAF4333991.1 unnamed protein product [Rotaria socialis]
MTSTIQNLLVNIKEERKKIKNDEDDDFILVQKSNSEWPKLFDTYFSSTTTRLAQTSTGITSDDDLVFYVTRKTADNVQNYASRYSVEAFRHHDTKRQPKLGAPEYDWEETTNLNLVLHQFEYTVTTAVCVKPTNQHLQIIKRLSTRVYASPSCRGMENKGIEEIISYPNIYFTVDNFEDVFCEMFTNEGQIVCVELIAKNPALNDAKVLFLGSIKYEALKQVYETRATTSTRVAQRVSLGMYTKRKMEFVRMRGPNGKGHAQMAVSRFRPAQSNIAISESNSTTSTASINDADNWSQRHMTENGSASEPSLPTFKQQNTVMPEVESTDIQQELSHDAGGFLGRTLNQAMGWMRKSNPRLNQTINSLPLQTCLTYISLPCNLIVKDILESNSMPILTVQ